MSIRLRTLTLLLALCAVTGLAGCGTLFSAGTRTTLIPPITWVKDPETGEKVPSDLLRLGPGVKARVYYWNAATSSWLLSRNKIEIPEGWLVGPPPPGSPK